MLGLRTHSEEAYQKSLQLYLATNNLKSAEKVIKKLLAADRNNPVTLLLLSQYYSSIKNNNEALKSLERAYEIGKILSIKGELTSDIYETILLNLIKLNISYNNPQRAKEYISELESIKPLSNQVENYIKEVKKKLSLT